MSSVIASAAFTAPSLSIDEQYLPLIDRALAYKIVNSYIDEALKLVRDVGIEPIPMDRLAEDGYLICGESLIYIGRFYGGSVSPLAIAKTIEVCYTRKAVASLHTHPIPLHIPTPDDIVSSKQLGIETECVLSRVDRERARAICVKPRTAWESVIRASETVLNMLIDSISKYVVVGDTDYLFLLPFPTPIEVENLEKLFIGNLRGRAEILVIDIDLENREYAERLYA